MPYIQLPDGRYAEVPNGISPQDAMSAAMQQYPEAYGIKPPAPAAKSGIMAALGSGFQSGLGEAASGIGSAVGLGGLASWGQKQQAAAAAGYAPTSDADIAKAEQTNPGILGGLGTRATQFLEPYAQGMGSIAGRYGVPTLAAIPVGMAAEAAAPVLGLGAAGAELAGASTLGGRALSMLGTNTVKGAASAVGFGAVNTTSYVGDELNRQKERGEPADYGTALAYGLAHGAIDQVVGGVLHAPMQGILGKTAAEQAADLVPRVLSGELTTAQAQSMVSGTLRNIAQGTAQNAVVGTGMMVGHEALNRAAAGQDLTSPEALQAYAENAKGALAFAPIFGAMHGLGARGVAEKELGTAGAERSAEQAAATETAATQPDALRQVYKDYTDAKTNMQNLQKAVNDARPAKGIKVSDEAAQAFTDAKDAALKQQDTVLKPALAAYTSRKSLIDPIIKQDALDLALQKRIKSPTAPLATDTQQALPEVDAAGAASVLPSAQQAPNAIDTAENVEAQRSQTQQYISNLQQKIADTNDPTQIKALSAQHVAATQALAAMPENAVVAQNKAIADAATKLAQAQKALDTAKTTKQYNKLPELAQNVLDLKDKMPKAVEATSEAQQGFDFSEPKVAAPVEPAVEPPTTPIATETQQILPDTEPEQLGPTLRGAEQTPAADMDTERLRSNLTQQVDELESRLYESESTTPAESLRLIPMLESAQKALASLPAPEATQAEQQQIRTNDITAARQKLGTAQKAWSKAKDLGDKDGMRRSATKIAQLEEAMPKPLEFPNMPEVEKSSQLDISETAHDEYLASKAEGARNKEDRKIENLNKTKNVMTERVKNTEDPEEDRRMVDSAVSRLRDKINEPRRAGEKSAAAQANELYEVIEKLKDKREDATLSVKEIANIDKSILANSKKYDNLVNEKITPIKNKIDQLESGRITIKDVNETKADKLLRQATENATGKNAFDVLNAQKKALAEARKDTQKNSDAQKKNKYRIAEEKPSGKTQTEVSAFTDKVTTNWKNKPPIEVVQSLEDLPEAIRAQAEKDKVNPKGVYDPESGKIFIVADNAKDSHDVAATIAHEALGHFGLRSILGDTYGKVMDDMFMGNEAIRKVANEHINRGTDRRTATEEALAEMAETGAAPTLVQKIVNFVRKAARKIGLNFDGITDGEVKALIASAREHVISGGKKAQGLADNSGAAVYRTKSNPALSNAMSLANDTVGKKERSIKERLSGNLDLKALVAETHFVDQFAPARVALSGMKDSYKAMQTQYYLSMSRQVNNVLGSVLKTGALQRVIDTDAKGIKRFFYQAKEGANLVDVNKRLSDANVLTGSSDATNKLFSLYTIAKRAENVGISRMNYGENITQARLDQAMKEIASVSGLKEIFNDAQKQYHEFNSNMVDFAVQSGSIAKDVATKMLANKDYVPYYRENKDGSVSLLMGNEEITKIGNIKSQPYLHELVGGDQRIMDFNSAAVQNAQMLLNMGLRNTGLKDLAYNMRDTGLGDVIKGAAALADNKFNFKQDGEDFHLIVSDKLSFPPALLIKGLEGIPVQTSTILKIAGMPSNLLRQIIVANPITAARILFKDTISSSLVAGSNLDVMSKALQNAKSGLLEKRGIVGGELFQGLPEDMAHVLREVQSGKPGWESLLSKAHVLHAKADALTRQVRYESYIKQGLSEGEATHQALESMNFTRRGISPSIHILNTLNPFINSQIQGLNTLVKAIRGNMPYNDKLDIQRKIVQRGMMIAASSIIYSAIMQDDDAYKNATPEQKYNNWFVPIPGSNEKFRVPIPFESGILFKAIPEALVNAMYDNGDDAAEGMRQAIQKLIPGGDTLGVPQILRPAIEAKLGTAFYTGRSIESAKEQQLPAGNRSRANTTAFADELGSTLNVSPVMIDHLLQGYTGSMGTAVVSLASSLVFNKQQPEGTAALHVSQMPIIGSVFQPEDAGNVVNQAYATMQNIKEIKNQYNSLKNEGRTEEANTYAEKMASELAMAGNAAKFDSGMKQFSKQMQSIKNMPSGTAQEQMERLDAIKKLRTNFAAESLAQVADKK